MKNVDVSLDLIFETVLSARSELGPGEGEHLMKNLYEMAEPVNKNNIIEFSRTKEEEYNVSSRDIKRALKDWVEKHG